MKVFEITLLFLGSVIGAGFATGAEIITFFGNLHLPFWVIALSIGITMLTVILLQILQCYRNNQTTKVQQKTGKEIVSIIIYFILFTAMTAGVTSLTNNIFITLASLILSVFIVLFGFNKLSRINFFIVLVIIVLIITTALPHITTLQDAGNHQWQNLPKSIFWGFLYAGLNCFMFPELIKAFAQKHQRKTLLWAGVISTILIMLLASLILTTVKNAHTEQATIPLFAAAPNVLTIVIILLAILTSQYTALFAIKQRSEKVFPKLKNRPTLSLVGICILAFASSFCGFNSIINFAYPIIGAITCFSLLISWLKS